MWRRPRDDPSRGSIKTCFKTDIFQTSKTEISKNTQNRVFGHYLTTCYYVLQRQKIALETLHLLIFAEYVFS